MPAAVESSIGLPGPASGTEADVQNFPHNRIRIFISSSMRDEGEFSWFSFREALDRLLLQTPLFDPFAIEDHASIERSRSYYLNQVEQAGIVISVIREELRQGTEDEIRHAVDCGKPLVLILAGNARDEATTRLMSLIEERDYCTYYHAHAGTAQELAHETYQQLVGIVIDLVNKRVSQWQDAYEANVVAGDSVRYSIPKASLAAFGDATAALAKRFGCDAARPRHESSNAYLAPLGNAIVSWLVDGDLFSLEPFMSTIHLAMKDAGISDGVLDCRVKALDFFTHADYEQALAYERRALSLLPDAGSWLYGNCLIDIRNLSGYAARGDWMAGADAQGKINELAAPALFPLATYFSNSALSQTLRTERKYRTRKPNAVIFDSTLSRVLDDLASYAFASLLYGSVASFNFSRILIAHALLDYADMNSDGELAYEGIKLLALAGEASEFTAQFNNDVGLSNALKAGADDLWALSDKGITTRVPSMRCALIRQAAPYFSDEAFPDIESYVSQDLMLFSGCRHQWLLAVDAIKLRMSGATLADLILETLSRKLYASAPDIGRIISRCNLDGFPKESLQRIVDFLKAHAANLIKDNMPLSAFAVVGRCVGEDLVGEDLLATLDAMRRSEYLQGFSPDREPEKSYVDELARQFKSNNTAGRYACPAYTVAPAICSLLDKGASAEFVAYLGETLNDIVAQIGGYMGFAVALDEPMAVLCRYVCMLRSEDRGLPDAWREHIESIKEDRYATEFSGFFNNFDARVWRVRVRALRVAAGLEDGIDFLADGLMLGSYSECAAGAYLESLGWLVASPAIPDELAPLVRRICDNAAELAYAKARIKAAHCLVAYCKRWGLEEVADAILALTRDRDDSVVYSMLRLCKEGALGDGEFENRIIGLLSHDANWFIRWHAENDPSDHGLALSSE
ncbi:hypothetical protein [Thermophilibacter provencensis]|uniref:hypothetical protein n=1 Tax=Thermophilibacter provencensis TaxID=1852386 RepID=UPI002357134B|nr:hypothetical protein [Thermophilibacter provencensis]